MVVQKSCKICFKCGMCCFYDVLIVFVIIEDVSIGEVYCCYYIFLDGMYCGCQVLCIVELDDEEE